MKRASERSAHRSELARLADTASALDLPEETISLAQELYLLSTPVGDRSVDATLAVSCYAAALVTGHQRPQTAVAEAFDVSRLSIQSRWRDQLELVGLEPPEW